MNKILFACKFASVKHKNQRRKDADKTPYINHPLEVAEFLSSAGITNADTLIASILHDTIEDTNTTKNELTDLFGDDVCRIVSECTDDKSLSKIQRKKLQIEHAKHASNEAKLVKLGDKWSNISSILKTPPVHWTPAEKIGYVKWCYKVCENCFGVNENVDKQLKELFLKFGVTNVTDNDLEEYYSEINFTE